MPKIGTTVLLKSKFHTLDNQPADVDNITLTIYDKDENVIEEITSGITNPSTGEYNYYYKIPQGFGFITYEFKGELESHEILDRKKIERKWV